MWPSALRWVRAAVVTFSPVRPAPNANSGTATSTTAASSGSSTSIPTNVITFASSGRPAVTATSWIRMMSAVSRESRSPALLRWW